MIGNGTATMMDVNGNHRHLVGPRHSGSSGMTAPIPSSALKMSNGVRHHQQHMIHPQAAAVHQQLNSSKVSHQGPPMQTTPTLQVIKPQAGLDLSVRDLYLHDTSSQELSRSALSSSGPRLLRTPNPNLTPTPAGCTGGNPASSVATTSNATASFPPFNPANSRTLASSTSPPPLPLDDGGHDLPSDAVGSVKELLGSLALLSVISAIVAFLAVLFLTRIMVAAAVAPHSMPCNGGSSGGSNNGCILHIDAAEYRLVYEVIIGLTACTISLDFTCLLICCAQFMFTSKLMKSPHASDRAGQYLRQSSFTRIIAVGGFFISIPVLLTGIILHAFIQFEAKPAIITSTLLGVSIIFCGLAMIHNVYVWQREKTKVAVSRSSQAVLSSISQDYKGQHAGVEPASGSPAMDTTQNVNMELSTLV